MDSRICGFFNSSTELETKAILSVHCPYKIINTSAQNTAFMFSHIQESPSITFSSGLYKNATVTPWELPSTYLEDWDRSRRLRTESWSDTVLA